MVYYTYLLCCWKDKNSYNQYRPLYGHLIYCGYTYNIFQRLVQHIKGVSKRAFTKRFKGNIRLAYLETYKTRKEAINREDEIKSFIREEKIKLIYHFKENHLEILEFIETNLEHLL